MKIAVDCRMIGSGGIGTFISGLLRHMVAETSIDFLLIGNQDKLKNYQSLRNCIIQDCCIPIFSFKELLRFPVKEINKCDCFYSPNYNIPSGISIPVISTIHDVIFLDIPNLSSFVGHKIRKLYLKYAIAQSDFIFTVSEFSKRRILHHFPKLNNIGVCYNGVNDTLLNSEEKKPYGLPSEGFYLFVGNVKPYKGLRVLINAFNIYKSKGSPDKLLIVGEKENFKTGIGNETLTYGPDVVFTGKIDDNELKYLLSRAKALILPSHYEGFGIPPLEALSIGTPAIVSDIAVFKEIYNDFPITYFKDGDYNQLANLLGNDLPRVKLTDSLYNKYSYKKSCDIILSRAKHII